jgi:hypothetical protein
MEIDLEREREAAAALRKDLEAAGERSDEKMSEVYDVRIPL